MTGKQKRSIDGVKAQSLVLVALCGLQKMDYYALLLACQTVVDSKGYKPR